MSKLDLMGSNYLEELIAKMGKEPAVSPDYETRKAAYLEAINKPVTVPGATTGGDIYNAFAGKEGGLGKGMLSILSYLGTPEGKQIIAGLISNKNPLMGGALAEQAEREKAGYQAKVNAAQNLNMEKLKLQGEQLKQEGEQAQKGTEARAKTLLDVLNYTKGGENKDVERKLKEAEIEKISQDIKSKPIEQVLENYKGKISPDDAMYAADLAKRGITPKIVRTWVGTITPGAYPYKVERQATERLNILPVKG